jgi:hypothetical protein
MGTPYTPSLTNKWFKPAPVKAELSGFDLYCLRHTNARLLIANGENGKVASERLGLDCGAYPQHLLSRLASYAARAAERIEQLLFSAG